MATRIGERPVVPDAPAPVVAAPGRRAEIRRFAELVLHLARREIAATHRFTILGWAWPLARQLAQLGVLVLVFSSVVNLGIKDFPVFVFTGLIAWNSFSFGLNGASTSLLAHRHLVFQTRFPAAALPIVAVAVPLVDFLMALPVLALMLVLSHQTHLSALAFPLVLVVQLALTCGLAWIVGSLTVFLRDVPNLVVVSLNILFYLTPVFYSASRIPSKFRWLIDLNPMSTIVSTYRAVLMAEPVPSAWLLAYTVTLSAVLLVSGMLLFRRLQGQVFDEL